MILCENLVTVPQVPFSVNFHRIFQCPRVADDVRMEGASGISADSLASLLSGQDERPVLVLDCRPFMTYNQGHVVQALNVHCPRILKRRSGGFVALENIVPDCTRRSRLREGGYCSVVVYDHATWDLASADKDSNLYSVVKSLLQQVDLQTVCYLQGGYEAFSQDCPLLCATKQFSVLSSGRPAEPQPCLPDDEPVEILPHLLLGNVRHCGDGPLLQRLGITALVNVSTSCANHFPALFNYLSIPVRDSAHEELTAWFPAANYFIDEVLRCRGRVLVHCQAGRSRSATICLAYLMKTLNLSLDAAFDVVRSRREVIDPNLNFMRQLQDYRLTLDRQHELTASPQPFIPSPGFASSCPQPSRTPREAPAPISLPSLSLTGLLPPANSAPSLPPPSPATASDVSFSFFSFSAAPFSCSGALPADSPPRSADGLFPPSTSLEEVPARARTPEIPLPS